MTSILKIELSPKRIFGLDLLRAFAILFVILAHGSYLLPEGLAGINGFFVFDGVSIFFVLSGFLIGGIFITLIEKNELNKTMLLNFWKRRWFRTLPTYFLVLTILVILHVISTGNFNFLRIGSYYIFSQNLVQVHPDFFPEAWSLSVEEWFYLTMPLLIAMLIWFFKITPKKSVLLVALIIIPAVALFRYYRFMHTPVIGIYEYDSVFRRQVITRLDALMFGVLGAYIHFYHFTKWIRYKNILFVTGIVLFLVSKFYFTNISGLFSAVFSFTFISIATLLLLPFLNGLKSGKGFLYKGITYISLISYSMYLLNLSVIKMWIIDSIPWTSIFSNNHLLIIIRYGLYWCLVIVLSILLYKYFEIPMTKLREKRIIKMVALEEVPVLVVG